MPRHTGPSPGKRPNIGPECVLHVTDPRLYDIHCDYPATSTSAILDFIILPTRSKVSPVLHAVPNDLVYRCAFWRCRKFDTDTLDLYQSRNHAVPPSIRLCDLDMGFMGPVIRGEPRVLDCAALSQSAFNVLGKVHKITL